MIPLPLAAESALTFGGRLGDTRLLGEQQIMPAFLWRDSGDRAKAQSLCRQAIATFEKHSDTPMLSNARALLAELG